MVFLLCFCYNGHNKEGSSVKGKRILWIVIGILVIILVASVFLFLKHCKWGFAREVPQQEAALRHKTIQAAEQWMGVNQFDGSHQAIIDIYNEHTPLPQNYLVNYNDKWCATYISTIAIQCDLTRIIPKECGCQRQIGLFSDLGRWIEDDNYVPLPGDIIYYSSEGAKSGENTGWSDHVGLVVGTLGNYIKVIEGNVAGFVAVRYMKVDDDSIRGYGLPDYASIIE